MKTVEGFGLDFSVCIGQGYDGASTVSSERVGATSTFQNHAEHVHHFHCAMHCLNVSASKAVSILPVQYVQEIVLDKSKYFSSSAKRTDLLNKSDNTISKEKVHHLMWNRIR